MKDWPTYSYKKQAVSGWCLLERDAKLIGVIRDEDDAQLIVAALGKLPEQVREIQALATGQLTQLDATLKLVSAGSGTQH